MESRQIYVSTEEDLDKRKLILAVFTVLLYAVFQKVQRFAKQRPLVATFLSLNLKFRILIS